MYDIIFTFLLKIDEGTFLSEDHFTLQALICAEMFAVTPLLIRYEYNTSERLANFDVESDLQIKSKS